MAGDILTSVSQDERERAVFRSRRMYQTDLQSNLNTAFDKGEKQGEKKKAFQIAQNLIDSGMPLNQVEEFTDLCVDDIKKLKGMYQTDL